MKIKDKLIKLLGGYTEDEVIQIRIEHNEDCCDAVRNGIGIATSSLLCAAQDVYGCSAEKWSNHIYECIKTLYFSVLKRDSVFRLSFIDDEEVLKDSEEHGEDD